MMHDLSTKDFACICTYFMYGIKMWKDLVNQNAYMNVYRALFIAVDLHHGAISPPFSLLTRVVSRNFIQGKMDFWALIAEICTKNFELLTSNWAIVQSYVTRKIHRRRDLCWDVPRIIVLHTFSDSALFCPHLRDHTATAPPSPCLSTRLLLWLRYGNPIRWIAQLVLVVSRRSVYEFICFFFPSFRLWYNFSISMFRVSHFLFWRVYNKLFLFVIFLSQSTYNNTTCLRSAQLTTRHIYSDLA